MRYYVPDDSDGLEPTDFDVYYDYPAKTDKGVAARFYIKIERDPPAHCPPGAAAERSHPGDAPVDLRQPSRAAREGENLPRLLA